MDEEFKNLIDYARGGAPPADRPVPRKQPIGPNNVVTLQPKAEPTLQDEILQMLDELAAAIRAGTVSPSHLIMGWGEYTTVNGQPATSYVFDATGLTTFETIGHLHTYAVKLASGEGE